MLLTSVPLVSLRLPLVVGATAILGEVQGIYSLAGSKNTGSSLHIGDDSSFKHDLLISQMGPSGFTPMV